MAGGAHDEPTLRRYADAQTRLEHAGGWAWRDHAAASVRGLGFAEDDLDRPLGTFSGGELTRASLARALAGSPDLLLLDEPTNHLDVQNLEWLERELETIDAAVILVAHDRWFLEAVTTSVLELVAGRRPLLRRAVARVAAGEGRARSRRRQDGGPRLGRHRAARTLRRAVPVQEVEGEAGAGQAHTDRAAREGALRRPARGGVAHEAPADARLRLPRPAALRTHRPRGRRHHAVGGRQATARRRGDRHRARREGRPRRAERLGQDDAPRRDPRRPPARRREDRSRPRRRARLLLAACDRAADERIGPRCDGRRDGAVAPARTDPARAVPLLRLGDARAARDRALRRRAEAARTRAAGRVRRELPRPRRADEPSRRRVARGARGRARGVPGDDPPRFPRPRAPGRRARSHRRVRGSLAPLVRRWLGRPGARARGGEYACRTRAARAGAAAAPRSREPCAARRPSSTLLEGQIAGVEARIAELERKLADDWSDMDVLGAHRAARDELVALLERWEVVFAEAQTT